MLDPSRLYGIIPPIVTPFEGDGATVSEAGVHHLIDFLLAHGVHGLFVAGTTGEAAALDDAQWQRLVPYVVEAARGRVPVIAGVSTATTGRAVRRAGMAAELGADTIVANIPYYYPPSQGDIFVHYQALARATELPLLLYNIPQHTQEALTEIYRVMQGMSPGISLIGGIKCALAIMGVNCGPLAAPMRTPTPEEHRRIEAILRAGGLLE